MFRRRFRSFRSRPMGRRFSRFSRRRYGRRSFRSTRRVRPVIRGYRY